MVSILSRLIGGGSRSDQAFELHGDFKIVPEPMKEGSQYRIAARIEKEMGGEVKSHRLIRADTLGSQEAAAEASVAKAKMLIDEQGDGLFC